MPARSRSRDGAATTAKPMPLAVGAAHSFNLVFALLSCAAMCTIWGAFTWHGWATDLIASCERAHAGTRSAAAVKAACGFYMLEQFFLGCTESPTYLLVLDETFRLFMLGSSVAVYLSFKTNDARIVGLVGIAPLAGQFITGACASVPGSLALVPLHSARMPSRVCDLWSVVTLVVPVAVFWYIDASHMRTIKQYTLADWLVYLVLPLVPHALSFIVCMAAPRAEQPELERSPLLAAALVAFALWSAVSFHTELRAVGGHFTAPQNVPQYAIVFDGSMSMVGLALWLARTHGSGAPLIVVGALLPAVGPSSAMALASAFVLK